MRTCIACRQKRSKRELLRVVRRPEGTIEIDPKGKLSGRGAYLCPSHDCWQAALDQRKLGQALKCQVGTDQVAALQATVVPLLAEWESAGAETPPDNEHPV